MDTQTDTNRETRTRAVNPYLIRTRSGNRWPLGRGHLVWTATAKGAARLARKKSARLGVRDQHLDVWVYEPHPEQHCVWRMVQKPEWCANGPDGTFWTYGPDINNPRLAQEITDHLKATGRL